MIEFDYFTADGAKTEDCTEAKTLRPSGATVPHLRLVGDAAPSADELYARLVALLSPAARDEDMVVLTKDQLFAGNYDATVVDRPFVVRVTNEEENMEPVEARIAAWLATPNPSLDGDRPEALLKGDPSSRCRLGYVIAEMEQGAFS